MTKNQLDSQLNNPLAILENPGLELTAKSMPPVTAHPAPDPRVPEPDNKVGSPAEMPISGSLLRPQTGRLALPQQTPPFINPTDPITAPVTVSGRVDTVLEVSSDIPQRKFSTDERMLVKEVVRELSLALENARAYQLSQQALAEMQELDRVKSQFLANMSHELRTPLNSIIGFSRVILKGIDGPVTDTQEQDLSAIHSSGQHLLALITDILDLSKIEAGKMELQFAEVNLADLINSVMSTAAGLVKDRPIRLAHTVSPDLPMVRADAIRVRQVLINFLSNAAKFTESGSITVEARVVDNEQTGQEVLITVADTGVGIAPADQSRLFQPFSQVDDSPTRKTGGTGLGLSISRSLVEMHGGRIGLLHSQAGEGSTFYFTLPLTARESVILETDDTVPDRPAVLCIDDDPQVISLYERYLEPHGFKVLPLTDSRQALDTALRQRPIAITLDIMMANMDGWQVLSQLKNDPQTHSIPVVVCSILEEHEKCLTLGAASCLVKPFLQEELLNALQTALQPAQK